MKINETVEGFPSSAGNLDLSNAAQERKIDPNRRLRMVLAVISGVALCENLIFVLFLFTDVARFYLNGATYVAALTSSALAFINILVILVYLFKRKQDGSFMYPLTIIGIIQAIMITVMRLYLFITVQQLFDRSILFGPLVAVTQTIIQFILFRKDLALTFSRIDEYQSLSEIVVEDPSRRLRVIVGVLSGFLLFFKVTYIATISIFLSRSQDPPIDFFRIYLVLYLVSSILAFIYAAGNISYILLLKQQGQYFLGQIIYGAIQILQLLLLNLYAFFKIIYPVEFPDGNGVLFKVFAIMMISPLILIATFICQVILMIKDRRAV